MKRTLRERLSKEKGIDIVIDDDDDDDDGDNVDVVASLWKGAGIVMRLKTSGEDVIVKRIDDNRRLTEITRESYRVEQRFYRYFARDYENIPICHLQDERVANNVPKKKRKKRKSKKNSSDDDILGSSWNFFSVFSDLSVQFPISEEDLNYHQALSVMKFFAKFHATNMNHPGAALRGGDKLIQERLGGLWNTGTYWTLDRRRHELETMVRNYEKELHSRVLREHGSSLSDDIKKLSRRLHSVAEDLHNRLSPGKQNPSHWFTIIHGDAKGANILLQRHSDNTTYTASLLDFQWAGGGLGCRDIAYFMISAVDPSALKRETELLRYYYTERRNFILRRENKIKAKLMSWDEFLDRYEIALCDFMRWLCGYGLWGGPAERWSLERVSSILRSRLNI